jgi:hypothetical protein
MVTLLALLALAADQPPPVPTDPAAEGEIEVIANKLRDWRGTWKMRDGAVTCKTTRSTGDKAVDAIGCEAMVQCMGPLAPQWQAIEDAKLPRREMEARLNGLLEAAGVGGCIAAHREQGIAALATARRSARS